MGATLKLTGVALTDRPRLSHTSKKKGAPGCILAGKMMQFAALLALVGLIFNASFSTHSWPVLPQVPRMSAEDHGVFTHSSHGGRSLLSESSCDSTYSVAEGDTCPDIWTTHELSEYEFQLLNPEVNCERLEGGQTVCVDYDTTLSSSRTLRGGGYKKVCVNARPIDGHLYASCDEVSPLLDARTNQIFLLDLPNDAGSYHTFKIMALSGKVKGSAVQTFHLWKSGRYNCDGKGTMRKFPKVEIQIVPAEGKPCRYLIQFTASQRDALSRVVAYGGGGAEVRGGQRRLSQSCPVGVCAGLSATTLACAAGCAFTGPFLPFCAAGCGLIGTPAVTCCVQNCFPGSSTVEVMGRGPVRMDQLSIGDRVRTVDPAGRSTFQEVYLFGHRDADTMTVFTRLTLDRFNRTLTLSPHHFIQRSTSPPSSVATWRDHETAYAKDVQRGDVVWTWDPSAQRYMAATVVSSEAVLDRGLFNPFTTNGVIEVGGVLASCHSDWFLDAHVPVWTVRHLAAVYQVVLAPVRWCYALLGADTMHALDVKYDLAGVGAEGTLSAYAGAWWVIAKSGFK